MAITAGGSLNSVPAPKQQTLSSNYLDLASGSTDWGQQYVPDLMEKLLHLEGFSVIPIDSIYSLICRVFHYFSHYLV